MSAELEERVDVLEDVVGRLGTTLIRVLDNLEVATCPIATSGGPEDEDMAEEQEKRRRVARRAARKMIDFLQTLQIEDADAVDPRQLSFAFSASARPKLS